MISQRTAFMILSALVGQKALATVPLYGQCGGENWTGETDCVEGATCITQNPYYYQCSYTEWNSILAGAGASTAAGAGSTHATTSALTASTTSTQAAATTTQAAGSSSSNIIRTVSTASTSVNTNSHAHSSANSSQASAQTVTSTIAVASTQKAASSAATGTETAQTTSAGTTLATSTTAKTTAQNSSAQASSAKASSAQASTAASSASTSSSTASASDLKTVSGGFSGTGETTRYWDCCLPSYAWNGKSSAVPEGQTVRACDANGDVLTGYSFQSGCIGGNAYMCNDQAPFAVNDNLAYGFAAASISGATDETLACTCVKLTFTSTAVSGKEYVVQITNTGGDLSGNHFDLALPGGGVGAFTEGCTSEFGSGYSWGETYGGVSSASDCSSLPTALQAGCNFRFGWFEGADNPSVSFEQVVCPSEITDISGCVRTDE